ncbi:MAG: phenylalanine--tRNA ligase subunit beta [Clostridiales bacterium]|nr:phenylalanine--tRNA ligase subunit beta [Clostridiales bacterium]
MKVPMQWLREYVDIDMTAEEYASRMIMTGTAVEGVEKTGREFDGVVVGNVLTCEEHPDSDHLHICTVDVGQEAPLQIVCGAPNVRAGQLVPVALEGATLPGGKIGRGKLRGVESGGMICSGAELEIPEGLYPHVGEAGILVFREEVAPGTDVKEVFGLGDDIVDYEILANRPDCLSIWGIARESAAVLDEHCVMPEIDVQEDGEGTFSDYATVEVKDTENCPRYCARVIADVKIGPSPMWMRKYLHGAGVRPINNIVDITNYAMLETGHPMHAFDLSKVRDQAIVVRRARPGEELTTLDGKKHILSDDMLVIADRERATGLAGIMGGEESEILEDTHSVLFECAAFDRTNNRITARRLGVRTEASSRFEKGVCAATALEAIERACMLVNMLECGKVVPGYFDSYPNPSEPRTVEASVRRVCRLTGVDVPGEQMEDILNALNIDAVLAGDILTCEIPAWRVDIETEADIAEEVLRMVGYERIPSTLMRAVTMVGHRSDRQRFLGNARRALAAMGLYEILNYSFVSPKWLADLSLEPGDWRLKPVALRNPLGEDTSVMRTSLVPSMLSTLAGNLNRGMPEGKLFELSSVFRPAEPGELPEEPAQLCVGAFGEGVDFYAVKRIALSLLAAFGVEGKARAGGDQYYHPGRKAIVEAGGGQIAQMGEIHPDVAERFGIDRRVYVLEVDLERLMKLETRIYGVKELAKFPAVQRDLAVVVDESAGAGEMLEAIERAGGRTLESARLFDIYRGERIGEGKKSVAYALSFRASDRTLTDAEIASAMEKILKQLEQEFSAEIRK